MLIFGNLREKIIEAGGSMSGLKAAQKIKDIKPDMKIIVVTSMPELSYEKKARETVYPSEQIEVPKGPSGHFSLQVLSCKVSKD